MVDAQTIGVLVTAASVTAAAIYYIMTLRVQQRNMKLTLETRRIAMVENLMRTLTDYEGCKRWIELLNMEWTDYADFEMKYGSDNNVDAAAKRYAAWIGFNAMGMMLRNGMIDSEDFYDLGGSNFVFQWAKWRPIVEEARSRYWGEDFLRDWEYLNDEMMKVKMKGAPSYRVPETLSKFVPDR